MKLTGKKALITGGKHGIGLAAARLFIAEGAAQSADEARIAHKLFLHPPYMMVII